MRFDHFLRAARRRRRTLQASVLGLVSLLLTLGGPMHRAHEALHAACDAVSAETAIVASCGDGCTEPGHDHHGHHHGACTTCRALSAPVVAPARIAACDAPAAILTTLATADAAPRHGTRPDAPSRGPPTVLSPRC